MLVTSVGYQRRRIGRQFLKKDANGGSATIIVAPPEVSNLIFFKIVLVEHSFSPNKIYYISKLIEKDFSYTLFFQAKIPTISF